MEKNALLFDRNGTYYIQCIKDGPFKPKIADGLSDKLESQWTQDERRVINQDQCLKSIIISCFLDDIIKLVIKSEIAKARWTNLVHSFKGPSNTKENRIMDLKLEYQTFRAKPSESLSQTYTCYKTLLNELSKDGVTLSKHKINAPKTFQSKNKGLVAETFNWDEEEVLDEEEVIRVQVLMALVDDELSMGKNHARNTKWIDITMKKDTIVSFYSEEEYLQSPLSLVNPPLVRVTKLMEVMVQFISGNGAEEVADEVQRVHSLNGIHQWSLKDTIRDYSIRGSILSGISHQWLTVPPSYCRHVRVGGIVVGTMAGTIIRTVQADLLQATLSVSSAPIVRDIDLEDDHMDTLPSENTSEISVESESLGSPPELIPVRRCGVCSKLSQSISTESKEAPLGCCKTYSEVSEEYERYDDSKTFNKAMKFQDVSFWKEAINDEMDFIMGNNTWMLTDLPLGCRPLGFKQKSGIDYFDTYAPVTADSYVIYSQSDYSSDGCEDSFLECGTRIGVQVDLTNEFLSSRFFMKDMGEADVIFGIRIKHESNGIVISQSHYIEKVLKKFNYSDCTPVSTPLDTCEKLMTNKGPAVSQLEYSSMIGCLMYGMTCTRPDIAFAVGKLSMYTSNPVLEGYNDASWISNTEDNSPASGWVFLLGGGAISWASKKQTCITGSTMKSKFVALAAAGKEAEWLKKLAP
nr:zinc finger, CCHC-type [Tanacetum cinerariifolium]